MHLLMIFNVDFFRQVVLGSPTVLRLANALRLSQVRIPGGPGTSPGNVRVPQHRILLTRGAVPGQAQTQVCLIFH